MADETPRPVFEVEKQTVLAKSRALSAEWTCERPQTLTAVFRGVSIREAWTMPVPQGMSLWQRIKRRVCILLGRFTLEDVLAEMLAVEITTEIDREIMQAIRKST
jgi:hypothetical protein